MKPYYEEKGITIYHGDCREILPSLPKVDLVLTDPPYGLGDKWKSGGWRTGNCGRGRLWDASVSEWDASIPDFLPQLIECFERVIVWGGNYFNLHPASGWLVWDKGADMSQAQAELAYTTLDISTRIFRLSPLGVWGNGGANDELKEHPTQKPLRLIKWCIGLTDAQLILDPFMGSGTTLRAAKDLGRQAIGIEIEEKYCEIAANRLRQEVLQFG